MDSKQRFFSWYIQNISLPGKSYIIFYALKVLEDGRPWLDMAHIVSCLNKFDAGVSDKITLMSRDEQNVLVVAYSELKICLEQSYAECVQSAKAPPSNTTSAMTAAASLSSAVGMGMTTGLASTHYLG